MAKGINYKPTEENRKFLEMIQKGFKAKNKFKGYSQIINSIVTEFRIYNYKKNF